MMEIRKEAGGQNIINSYKAALFLLLVLLSLICIGCSSSGGSSGESAPLSYSGISTPIAIDENNADQLLHDTFPGSATEMMDIVQLDKTSYKSIPATLKMALIVGETIYQKDMTSSKDSVSAAIHSNSDTVYGNCGGSYSITISIDDVSGEMSGTMNYSSFCNDGLTLNGSVSYFGSLDLPVSPSSLEFESFTMIFNNVTGTDSITNESETMSGEITITENGSTSNMNVDMVIKDNNINKTYWINDYQITETATYNNVQQEFTGMYYDPDYGYVHVETAEPFVYEYSNEWPGSGIMIMEGAEGAAGGSSMARLTALSSETCQIEVDADGDGVFEHTETSSWSDIGGM